MSRRIVLTAVAVAVIFCVGIEGSSANARRTPGARAIVRTGGTGRVEATVGITDTGIRVEARVGGGGTRSPTASGPTRTRRTFQIVCFTPRSTTPPSASLTHRPEWAEVPVIGIDGTTRTETRVVRTWQEFRLPCNGGTYQVIRCVLGDCPEAPPVDPPPPDPIDVAYEAIDNADWEIPRPVFSPEHRGDDDLILVGLPFFWAVEAGQWREITGVATACNGISCTTAVITATPTILRFDPGNGDPPIDTCQRPGAIVRTADAADAESDDCQLIFQDRGRYQASVTIHYAIAYQIDGHQRCHQQRQHHGRARQHGPRSAPRQGGPSRHHRLTRRVPPVHARPHRSDGFVKRQSAHVDDETMDVEAPDRRDHVDDRRMGDRRGGGPGRRNEERRRLRTDGTLGIGAVILCTVGVGLALWASTHAPVVSAPSGTCADGIGGQLVRHRQLSMLWLPAAALTAVGLVLPSARRRPVAVLVLCGAFVGLAVAAVLRLDSWVEGLCLV